MEHTDQEGGRLLKTVSVMTQAECCAACTNTASCDVWVLGSENTTGNNHSCFLVTEPRGTMSRQDRSCGFVHAAPWGSQDSVLAGFPAFNAAPTAPATNFLGFSGCQIASTGLGKLFIREGHVVWSVGVDAQLSHKGREC